MSKESMTASELMAELANDPEYQRKMREKEELRRQKKEALLEDQKELIAACNAAGVQMQSVWDLVNTSEPYPNAIPILVKHLEEKHQPRTTEGIVRALTTPGARGIAFVALVRLFQRTNDASSELKWLIGAAIAESAMATDTETVIELGNDQAHGRGRDFLPLALVVSTKESVLSTLERWALESDMAKNAKKAIKLLR